MSTGPTQPATPSPVPSPARMQRSAPPAIAAAARPTPAPIRAGGIVVRFLVEPAHTRGGLAMFEFDVPAGARVPAAHSHDAYDETLYALRGRLTWTVGEERFELAPGECAVIPRGAVHRFDNLGAETATTSPSSPRGCSGRSISRTSPR